MTITLYYKYLKHDIDQWAFRLAEQRIDDPERKGLAEFDGTSSDDTFVRRKIELACAIMRGKLRKKMVTASAAEKDDVLPFSDSWQFELDFDEEDSARADVLNELMHAFIVRYVTWQWMLLNSPNEAASWKGMADDSLAALEDELWGLKPPVKRKRKVASDVSEVTIEVE